VPDQEELSLVTYGGPSGIFAAVAGEDGVLTQLGVGAGAERAAPEPDALQRLAKEVGLPSVFLLEPGLKAALPFEMQLR